MFAEEEEVVEPLIKLTSLQLSCMELFQPLHGNVLLLSVCSSPEIAEELLWSIFMRCASRYVVFWGTFLGCKGNMLSPRPHSLFDGLGNLASH